MTQIEPMSLSQRLLFMNYIAGKIKEEGRRVRVVKVIPKDIVNRNNGMIHIHIEERWRCFSWNRRHLVSNLYHYLIFNPYRCIVSNPYQFTDIVRYEARDENLAKIVSQAKEKFSDIEPREFYHNLKC